MNATEADFENGKYTTKGPVVYRNGYDLPIYGLDSGHFDQMHLTALTCIFISLICAVAVIISSFRLANRPFFTWTQSEKFVVYLAICDGLFNLAHSMDHLQILITRTHVYPPELCQIYGFINIEFILAQSILVLIIAISTFKLIYFGRDLTFGNKDIKLIVIVFGIPLVAGAFAAIFGMLGPTGAFCLIDGVNGHLANIFYTAVPLLIVFVNSVLYILTWCKIKSESTRIKNTLGGKAITARASITAAKTMSLFVAVFFIQWSSSSVYSMWKMFDLYVPSAVFQLTTSLSNIGGILNGVVYIIIKRRKAKRKTKAPKVPNESSTVEMDEMNKF